MKSCTMSDWPRLLVALAMIVSAARASGADKPAFLPDGDVRAAQGFYAVVFYYTPDPAAEPLATARGLAGKHFPASEFVSDIKKKPAPGMILFEEEKAPLEMYPVPGASYFKYAGRGLTTSNILAFRKTSRATFLACVMPKTNVWSDGRKFTELVLEFADATGAFIWDSATRECFSRGAWKKYRLDSWPKDGIPDLPKQFTIHLYQPDDDSRYLRAITLGMEKFALPDLVIERLISSDNRPAGNLINLVAQSLAEQPVIRSASNELFSLDRIENAHVRSNMTASLEDNATRQIRLALLKGRRAEGDPDNKLVEISFVNGAGKTEDERRADQLSKLWGASDSMVGVKHDEEILAASKRAKGRLAALRTNFTAGLKPGERLLVKAPFERDDEGNEWMWVEVMDWKNPDRIDGILQNDPFYIERLKAGAKVRIRTADVFDFIFYKADGTQEGNETGRLMEKQGGPKRTK